MFSTTWSKRSSTVLFAAAMTGLLWLWPSEAKPAGKDKPPTIYCDVTATPNLVNGNPEGILFSGGGFQYKISTSPPGWEVESLGDPPVPPTLTLYGGIAAHVSAVVGTATGTDGSLQIGPGTLVLQHNTSDPAYNWYTLLFFSWKIGKTSYSLWIHGAPPANPADGSPASLNSCAIDFTHDVDHPDNPHAGAHYRLEQMIGGKTTPYYGVTSFTVIVQPQ